MLKWAVTSGTKLLIRVLVADSLLVLNEECVIRYILDGGMLGMAVTCFA